MEATLWKTWVVPVALTIVAFIYGAWSIIAKAVLEQHDHKVAPLILVVYRSTGGAAVMYTAHRCLLRAQPGRSSKDVGAGENVAGDIKEIPRSDVFRFFILGAFMACNIGGNILALQFLPALTVSVFQPSLPVIAGVASWLMGIEELTWQKAGGLAVAAGGAVVVVICGARNIDAKDDVSYARGLPCLCLNVLGGALYMVFQKGVLQTQPPVLTAAMGFLVAALILFVVALATSGLAAQDWRLGGNHEAVFALLYAIFLVTSVNYSVLAWANKVSTPTTVTSFLTLQPVAAALLSWFWLGIVLTRGQACGGVAIIFGLLLFISSPAATTSHERCPEKRAI